ncbi:MAG: hypothetical protein VYC34_10755 [Planctomycetota bacterium]|nr:hypothetical protein [Planctomycetota bacterium]
MTGEVEFNLASSGPRAGISAGDRVTMEFQLGDLFNDSMMFPTRGYTLEPGTFSLQVGSTNLELLDQNTIPVAGDPYPQFVIRNNDPAVDGFFLGQSPDGFPGVPLSAVGAFGNFDLNFSVTYVGSTLSDLSLGGAAGTYDFTGLTNFSFSIDDGPVNVVGILFEQMTIVPSAGAVWMLAPVAVMGARRRRRGA